MAEDSVDCLFTKQKELWVILMSTITMLCNFVFCFLSFVYIWNEYKKLKITNKNHLLPLHEIVEGLYYFHCSFSVCLVLLVNKIPAERMNHIGRDFR